MTRPQRALGPAASRITTPRVTILGIGNSLLADEGIGVHVTRHLRPAVATRSDIALVDGGTLGFELLETIESTDALIVIDAAMLGAAPGTIRVLLDAAMDGYLGLPRRSAHEVGLRDLLDLARFNDRLPGRRGLIAVQPAQIDWGLEPTPAVRMVVPELAQLAMELAETWYSASQPESGGG